MNKKYFLSIPVMITIVIIVGISQYFNYFGLFGKSIPVATSKNGIYENSFMKVAVPTGWTAKEANKTVYHGVCVKSQTSCTSIPSVEPNPSAVNITKGNYILYINTQATQASGVEGGRFSEIAMGTPSADAVVTDWPSECGSPELHPSSVADHPRVDLYIGPSNKQPWCNIPANGKTAWFFSYITDTSFIFPTGQRSTPYFNYYKNSEPSGANGYVITMAYNSKDVNLLPVKGSAMLDTALSEMTDIVKTLEIKQQ